MKILLTGATGFIGAAVLDLAVKNGDEVLALTHVRQPDSLAWLERVQFASGSITAPPWREIAAFHPEICIHSAWLTTPGVYLESPENDSWVEWSDIFLKQLAATGTRRVVVLGTCLEYAMTGRPLSEELSPCAPVSRYARAKDELRRRIQARAEREQVDFLWGRVFYPYGPGEHPARLCSQAIRQMRQGKPLELQNPGSLKDYIFIQDLASAILAVAGSNLRGPVNLATGAAVSIGELAGTLSELLGREDLVRAAASPPPDPFAHVVAETTRLRSTGWSPQVSLRDGLKQLVASLPS